MKFRHILITAVYGLKTQRTRSLLTMLGIIIGISSIILIQSVGAGARELILNQVQGLGSRTLMVHPGQEPKGPSNFAEVFTDSLKMKDVIALQNPSNVQGISAITPEVIQSLPASFQNETVRGNILGTSDLIAKILELDLETGVFVSSDDVHGKSNVAVLGSKVKEKLFSKTEAVGEKIKIKGKLFRVIGVLAPKGQVALFDIDDIIFIPYTTAQDYLLGINYFHSFLIQAESEEIIPRLVSEIKATLRGTHGIDDSSKDDFHLMTQADAANRVKTITDILTILLVSVASISLVVGGIGIMNMMLVTVTERTHEIGLRKAIGATNHDILMQFLLEAVIITALGGMAGIIVGAFLSWIATSILSRIVSLGWVFTFPLSAAVIGLFVATFIGLLFGIYPAKKASRKSPMEALRYE